jgi:hypothetical protein
VVTEDVAVVLALEVTLEETVVDALVVSVLD